MDKDAYIKQLEDEIILKKRIESLLNAGARFDGNMGGKCRDILKHKKYLWTFVQGQIVEIEEKDLTFPAIANTILRNLEANDIS